MERERAQREVARAVLDAFAELPPGSGMRAFLLVLIGEEHAGDDAPCSLHLRGFNTGDPKDFARQFAEVVEQSGQPATPAPEISEQ